MEDEAGRRDGDDAQGKEEHRSCPGRGKMKKLAEKVAHDVCGVHSGHQKEPNGFVSRGMAEQLHRLQPYASSQKREQTKAKPTR